MLRDTLNLVHQRIRQACERAGRDPATVTLVAVTKGLPLQTIRDAVALGVTDVGENRVQEAKEKRRALGSGPNAELGIGNSESTTTPHSAFRIPHSVRWHLIGHLQRNKAKDAVALFDAIHSVDSLALADELERQASKRVASSELRVPSHPVDAFIQVNVSGEVTKFGCRPDEVTNLAQHIMDCPHLHLRGLMTIAPFVDDSEQARPCFRHLRLLRDSLNSELQTPNSELLLSMGMSHDFEVAIEEGADLIRIGTAIFR